MTDATASEMLSEPVPELAAPAETPDQATEAEAPAAAHEFAYPTGSTSQLIVDHFIDSEGDQSMNQIKAALPHVDPNTVESGVRRLFERGRLLRVKAGVYRLAPVPPAGSKPAAPTEPPKPEPDAEEKAERDRQEALERDRARKRLARERDRQAAAAARAEADQALHSQLLEATHGNHSSELAVGGDVSAIRAALELVPMDCIVGAIRNKTDKILCPANEPATSWREPRLLKAIAERYTRFVLVPRLVQEWSKAKATGKPVDASNASAAVQPPPAMENAPAVPLAQPAANPNVRPAIVAEPAALDGEFQSRVAPASREARARAAEGGRDHRCRGEVTAMPMPDDYEGSESNATGWALDQLIGRLGNIYTRLNLSPPMALRDAAKGWVSLSKDEIVRVVEDHLREHSRRYICGSGDGHFYLVQAAIRRALEVK